MSYKVAYFTAPYKDVVDALGTVQQPDVAFEHYGWAQVKDNGDDTYCFRFVVQSSLDTSEWDSTDTPPEGIEDAVVMGINDD
jgi:hypothetical protein